MTGSTVPELPEGRIEIDPPPSLEPREGLGGVLTSALPMLGSLGSVVVVATMAGQSGAGGHRSLLAAGMFMLGTLGFVVVQVDRQRARRVRSVSRTRHAYLRHLGHVRDRARQVADQQRAALRWHHPAPDALPSVVATRHRVWERTPDHPRRFEVRYATAPGALSMGLAPPDRAPADEPDPVATDALRRLLDTHGRLADLPVTVDLRSTARIQVSGDHATARSLVRALVCQAATFHRPEDLRVAVLTPEPSRWEWLKWLPHAHSPDAHDAVGPRRLVAATAAGLRDVLPGGEGHLVLVVDGEDRSDPSSDLSGSATTTVAIGPPDRPPGAGTLGLLLGDPGPDPPLVVLRHGRDPQHATADQCDTATAEAVARRLLPLHTAAAHGGGAPPDVLTLLGLGPPRAHERACPPRRAAGERLRLAIGVTDAGAPVPLDLKEAARDGMGPHGLLVGATGSGKSELLRTLVLGLALTHPPEQLNLVLVDFKGGATFAGLAPLPHVAAVVTNLVDDLALVERMQDALAGELVRRQQVLRDAGDLASVHDLEAARDRDHTLPCLPPLLVVVDEFSELLTTRPEMLDLFTAIGRLGRSLGLHLLLASQRLDEGRLRGLEAHLSYRIGLRTFSAAESRAVLGVPDAVDLPPLPGLGYLRTGPAAPVRFRAAYVSGPAVTERARRTDPVVLPFTLAEQQPAPAPPPAAPGPRQSLLDLAVATTADWGPGARRIWLPPLDRADALGTLLGPVTRDPDLGLVAEDWRARGLVVPLGRVDRPREQRHDPLTVDLSGAGGHVGVVGGPRTGRTTLVQTLVVALALTTTPRQTQVFVLDLAGGGCAPLADLPHVAAYATSGRPDLVRRVVTEVRDLLDRRERWFHDHGVDGIDTYRRLTRDGRAGDGHGEVFVVVDGWAGLRADFDDLETELGRLAARGLALGVHLVVVAGRWAELRAATRDLLGTRLELRLGDPIDSEVDRRAARLVPRGRPGRGLAPDGMHFLAALPRLEGDAGPGELVGRIASAWPGAPAPQLRLLPERLALTEVRAQAGDCAGPLLGLDDRMAPVTLGHAGHLVVLGDPGSGRTTTLRTLVREVVRTHPPDRLQLVLVDPRRTLLGEVPDGHLLAHHTSGVGSEPAMRELAEHLRGRLPGPEVSTRQLRDRSWWEGADVHVLVDDLELLAADGSGPLAALLPLLPHAPDVGLRVTVAQRVGGAARALREPLLRTLGDLGADTLLLPGRPDEGPLVGRETARPGPPGRGRLVTRDGSARTVQVAWSEPH